MPMREECKNFESRTYANGETVRKCNLDLAPDAPWRCPDPCSGYERRLADVAVLDEAEDIITSVGADVLAEVQSSKKKGWRRFRRK